MSHVKAGEAREPNPMVGHCRSTLSPPDQNDLGPSQPDEALSHEPVWIGKQQDTHLFTRTVGKIYPKKGRKVPPATCHRKFSYTDPYAMSCDSGPSGPRMD